MPIFEYKCSDCGCFRSDFRQGLKRIPISKKCRCGKRMKRVFSNVNTNMVGNPRWSRSMGVNPERIPEATRLYPGSVYNDKGDLLVESRYDKLKKMRERNLVEIE